MRLRCFVDSTYLNILVVILMCYNLFYDLAYDNVIFQLLAKLIAEGILARPNWKKSVKTFSPESYVIYL